MPEVRQKGAPMFRSRGTVSVHRWSCIEGEVGREVDACARCKVGPIPLLFCRALLILSSGSSGTSLQSPDRLTVHQMSADSTDCNDISSPRDKGHGHKQPLRFRILNNDISSHKSSNSSFDITPSRGLDHIDHQSRSLLKYCQSFSP